MKTHENEVELVYKDRQHGLQPTQAHEELSAWIIMHGTNAHAEALQAQVLRQAAALDNDNPYMQWREDATEIVSISFAEDGSKTVTTHKLSQAAAL